MQITVNVLLLGSILWVALSGLLSRGEIVTISNATKKYWIETVLVADHTVFARFNDSVKASDYLISLVSLTNNIFQHPSLGVDIYLVVKDIVWINTTQSDYILKDLTLNQAVHKFCTWTLKSYHLQYNYDHAIFISRDIHEAAGISPLNQMCQTRYSCTLVEDSGFFTAYPMAHELLHSLGVEHDGVDNPCDATGRSGNIMAPLIQSSASTHYWSDCTRKTLQKNMKANRFSCIRDYPLFLRKDLESMFTPGRYWSASEQCQIAQGVAHSRLCLHKEKDSNFCQQLWCTQSNHNQCSRITNQALLDGSYCGVGKMCQNGECLHMNNSEYTDHQQEGKSFHVASEDSMPRGNAVWSPFGAWSPCSQSCGIGTRYRKRICMKEPDDINSTCEGESREYQTCTMGKCSHWTDLREEQCEEYNKYKIKERFHWWKPVPPEPHDPCRLVCKSLQTGDIMNTSQIVRDGTSCDYIDSNAKCVQGECVRFDCHGVVNGTGKVDPCGICDGGGRNCVPVRHEINRTVWQESYRMMYIIPAFSRTIQVQMLSGNHILGLLSMDTGTLLLETDAAFQGRQDFVMLGSHISYNNSQKSNGILTVTTNGPILGAIAVQVKKSLHFLPSHHENPNRVHLGISYLRQLYWTT